MGGAKHLVVEITGEAGTGKTRLVSEFLKGETVSKETLVLRGNSVYDAQPAHWLWSAVLRNMLGMHTDKTVSFTEFSNSLSQFFPVEGLSRSLPFLGRLVSITSDNTRLHQLGNKAIATETKMALRDFIEILSKERSVVIVLEDLQWMDSTDAEVLDFIVKNCNSVNPVLFLLVRRSDHKNLLPPDVCTNGTYSICNKIVLDELCESDTLQFTAEFLKKLNENKAFPVSDSAMDFIYKQSSGNPFFLQELLLHLVDSEGLSLENNVWIITDSKVEFSTPKSLTGLLQSRLDRLPEPLRKALLNCSVFGMEFSYDIYRRVENKLGLPHSGKKVFNDLVDRQLLETTVTDTGRSYIFHHSFIQSTAYNSILSHNLKLLHKAAAQSIEEVFGKDSGRTAAKLARHWELAGEQSSAVEWAVKAQEHASQNYQYESVLKWGNKIDSWLSPLSDNPEALQELLQALKRNGLVLSFTHRWEQLHTLLERKLEIAVNHDLKEWIAETEFAMGSYSTAIRKIDDAEVHLQNSLTICQKFNLEKVESDVLSGLGVIAGIRREYKSAGEYFQKSGDLFSRHNNRRGEAKALGNLGILHRNMGETDKAVTLLEKVLTIFRENGDIRSEAVTMGNLGSLYHDKAQLEKAIDLFSKAIAIFHKLGDRMPEGIFLCNLGNALRYQKLFEQAEKAYTEALGIMDETGDKRTSAWIMTNMGLKNIAENRLEESLKLYGKAVSIFTEIGDEENMAISMAGKGYVHYLSGSTDKAMDDYMKSLQLISKLKLSQADFSDTFVKLSKKLTGNKELLKTIPWPEHWIRTDSTQQNS